MMSVSFRLSEKFPVFKTSAEASELIFNILGEILSLVVPFLGLMSCTSFLMSNLEKQSYVGVL